MKTTNVILTLLSLLLLTNCPKGTEEFEPNYDESKVPNYKLPDPFLLENGSTVKDSADWFGLRRSEIMEQFRHEVYGRVPAFDFQQEFIRNDYDTSVLNSQAIRNQVTIRISTNDKHLDINLLIYYPGNAKTVPVFLGYNFYGNHTIQPDTGIYITDRCTTTTLAG